jgi:hypothetical protein
MHEKDFQKLAPGPYSQRCGGRGWRFIADARGRLIVGSLGLDEATAELLASSWEARELLRDARRIFVDDGHTLMVGRIDALLGKPEASRKLTMPELDIKKLWTGILSPNEAKAMGCRIDALRREAKAARELLSEMRRYGNMGAREQDEYRGRVYAHLAERGGAI